MLILGLAFLVLGYLLRRYTNRFDDDSSTQKEFDRKPDVPLLVGSLDEVQKASATGLIAIGGVLVLLWVIGAFVAMF